ncbi:hypothetical protein EK904_010331 [Melospiza melodia maxima]|nr:hypothetical protein EK904_010331 [Melospiza melodia maxima]
MKGLVLQSVFECHQQHFEATQDEFPCASLELEQRLSSSMSVQTQPNPKFTSPSCFGMPELQILEQGLALIKAHKLWVV